MSWVQVSEFITSLSPWALSPYFKLQKKKEYRLVPFAIWPRGFMSSTPTVTAALALRNPGLDHHVRDQFGVQGCGGI